MRAGLLTAAGASTRMGMPKALLPWGGTSLIEYQIDRLGILDLVVVVLGADGDRIARAVEPARRAAERTGGATIEVVHNRDWSRGRSSSIALGATRLLEREAELGVLESAIISGVDQPIEGGLVPRLLAALVSTSGRQPLGAPGLDPRQGTVAVPTLDGRRGHPIALDRANILPLPELDALPRGLRTIVSRARVVEVAANTPLVRLDLNEPETYRLAHLDSFGTEPA